jgi:ribonucleoside-triphosphate reductase
MLVEHNTRNLLSDTKFFEGYSRYIEKENRYETWEESVERVMNTHRTFYKHKLTPELEQYINEAEQSYKNKEFLGSQRALQFGGVQLLKHNLKIFNCLATYADRSDFFGEYFYSLLCGCGVGFSVQKRHIDKLPMIRPRTKQAKEHIIEDSIEGWATSLDVLMSSFLIGGGKYPEYEGRRVYFNSNFIRKKGSPISGGFKAPGPEPLIYALNQIERLLTENAEEGILRPIVVYDICMFTCDAVLAGGVRRAATICLFSPDDDEMINAKIGDWSITNPQRARSNNSMVLLRKDPKSKFYFRQVIDKIRQFGEPGFVFVSDLDHAFNPCVEIGMYPKTASGISGMQGCNLCSINGSKCITEEDFYRICRMAAIVGTLQAGYTNFKFLSPASKEIFERESLLGVSITGFMNNPEILFNDEITKQGARIVKETNKMVAKLLGINPAARTTCVKPDGNSSVLLMSASGIHPEHSRKYIRNIQINKIQEVCDIIKKVNPYMVEESVWNESRSDYSLSFPVFAPENSIFKKDLTAIKFLEFVKKIQITWVEEGTDESLCVDPTLRHNVSNTIHVKDDEWNDIADYLEENMNYFSGLSFIAATGDKDYHQAPYIEILEPEEIVKKYGEASLFASGLIVDSTKGFDNLWEAILVAQNQMNGYDQETKDLQQEWIRRYNKFAENYFSGDLKQTEYCLKDVYLLYKWSKIQQNYQPVNMEDLLRKQKFIDADTTGAIACQAGGCEV